MMFNLLHVIILEGKYSIPKPHYPPYPSFVVCFVCFSQTYEVSVFCRLKPFESLVNQNIMNHEVTKAICRDSKSYKKQVVKTSLCSNRKKEYTGIAKSQKNIITLEDIRIFRLMMVFMKIPHKTMH
jgi:hypothetical protein